MDILTMAQINKPKKSGGAGYTETKYVRAPAGMGASKVPCTITSAEQLIGRKATVHEVNAYVMKKELERPKTEVKTVFEDIISYGVGSYNGLPIYDKPCLMVQLGLWAKLSEMGPYVISVCPGWFGLYPDCDTLLYVYETTSDALGLGVTLPKGWYAANSQTFDITPFNIEKMPLLFYRDGIVQKVKEKGWAIDDYFYEIAPLTKDYTFTMTEQLVTTSFVSGKGITHCTGYISRFATVDVFDPASYGLTESQYAEIVMRHVAFDANCIDGEISGVNYDATVEYETIHPIDPKFIPAMDSIILNGADGKQYKIAVNTGGQLVATVAD